MAVRLPGNTHRTTVIGRTGTGKTVAGLWHLSLKKFNSFPWIIFDAKGDELINAIADNHTVTQISLKDSPGKSGLYHLRATPPAMKSEAMEQFLWRIHKRGRCGLFLDESFTFDRNSDALNTVLTQGRSLQIPTIMLTQRPSWLSQFVFSEADFFQVFALNTQNDKKRVKEFVPYDPDYRLPDYHSWWYDVGHNDVREFSPVPPRDIILENFAANLKRQRRII